ncbi:MAG TPA: efflux RND transporter periplasmic adaptor subunit [Rubrivivax sp.]|nr:efflux RND transporter periplasmic adaptor subunit [Rubrivivax sp.]
MLVQPESSAGSSEFAAEVRARTESRIGFRVPGKLVARPAEVGQRVKAGQVLARLDSTDLQLAQQAAQAGAQAAQAAYALAQAEFKRYQELRSQGFISALELERRETGLKAQKAQLDQALAQQSVQGNQAAYAALQANAVGTITAVEAEVGAVLAAGTPVLRLAHDGPRDAVFAVPEDVVAALRPLLGRKGALQVRRWGAAAPVPATLREVAAAADPSTRTFLAKADLGAASFELGQTVTVVIVQPRTEAVLHLPLAAVVQVNGQSAVWVLDRASMTVKPQPVVVARAGGNRLVLASGLVAGQTVVTAGVHTLAPGQKVKLYGEAPAGPAPAASR